jgi:hypothetical protein
MAKLLALRRPSASRKVQLAQDLFRARSKERGPHHRDGIRARDAAERRDGCRVAMDLPMALA